MPDTDRQWAYKEKQDTGLILEIIVLMPPWKGPKTHLPYSKLYFIVNGIKMKFQCYILFKYINSTYNENDSALQTFQIVLTVYFYYTVPLAK